MPQLLDDFDPSTGSGTLNLGTKAGCARIRIWNESFYALVFQFQDGSQYLVPAWSMRTIQPHVPSPYVNWSVRATLNSTNPPATLVHVEIYSPSEFFDGVYTLALGRQTNVGNSIPVTSIDQLINRDGLSGVTVIDIANDQITDGTSVFRVASDGTLIAGYVPVLPGDTVTTAFQITPQGKVIVEGSTLEVDSGASFAQAVTVAATLVATGAISGSNLAATASVSGSGSIDVSQTPQRNAANTFDATGFQKIIERDTSNAAAIVALRIAHLLSSGTPAAGIGVIHEATLPDSGGTERIASQIETTWTDATTATRKSRIRLSVIGNGAISEALRVESLGTATPAIGVLGASAVARQALPAAATDLASAITLVNAIRTALIAFGFCS
jgi:hypothetical protein